MEGVCVWITVICSSVLDCGLKVVPAMPRRIVSLCHHAGQILTNSSILFSRNAHVAVRGHLTEPWALAGPSMLSLPSISSRFAPLFRPPSQTPNPKLNEAIVLKLALQSRADAQLFCLPDPPPLTVILTSVSSVSHTHNLALVHHPRPLGPPRSALAGQGCCEPLLW